VIARSGGRPAFSTLERLPRRLRRDLLLEETKAPVSLLGNENGMMRRTGAPTGPGSRRREKTA